MLKIKRNITLSLFFPIIYMLYSVVILAQDSSNSTYDSSRKDISFSGTWIRTVPDSVILIVEDYSADTFEFRMISNQSPYFGYLGEDRITPKKFARINKNIAYFNDTLSICDGYPLYNEDESPCKLLFSMVNYNKMEVFEENCYMIYGGAAITWAGEYNRYQGSGELIDFKGMEYLGPN